VLSYFPQPENLDYHTPTPRLSFSRTNFNKKKPARETK